MRGVRRDDVSVMVKQLDLVPVFHR